jgi:hypothetical protein
MHLAHDRGKWRDVVDTVMNDRALLHVISPVKKADTSCVIMFTCNVLTATSHMAQDSHTAVLSRTPGFVIRSVYATFVVGTVAL